LLIHQANNLVVTLKVRRRAFIFTQNPPPSLSRSRRPSRKVRRSSKDSLISTIGISFP